MQSESDPNASKASADERARLRRNQRNSRARKQEYVQDLERRWSECVKLGVQASAEIQKEARRVNEENKALRYIIHELGMSNDALQQRLRIIMSTRTSLPCNAQLGGAALASKPSTNTAPAVPSSNTNPVVALEPPPVDQAAIWPFQDSTGNDTLQSWNLYSWLDDLSRLKDAYSLNAQSQVDYNDVISPSNTFNPHSEGAEVVCDPLTHRYTITPPWLQDTGEYSNNNEAVITHVGATNMSSSQDFENLVLHKPGNLNESDIFNVSSYNPFGNGEYQ